MAAGERPAVRRECEATGVGPPFSSRSNRPEAKSYSRIAPSAAAVASSTPSGENVGRYSLFRPSNDRAGFPVATSYTRILPAASGATTKRLSGVFAGKARPASSCGSFPRGVSWVSLRVEKVRPVYSLPATIQKRPLAP